MEEGVRTFFAGATREFRTTWMVPANLKVNDIEVEHFCVRVDIDRYVDPRDAARNEIVVHNNWAQSNFDSTTVDHGSPPWRRTTALAITNTLTRSATFYTIADQDSTHFRLYLGHAWLRLQPGETRAVEAGYESLADDQVAGNTFERDFEEGRMERPDQVSFTSLVLPPDRTHCATPRTVWGAGLTLRAGRRTLVDDLRRDGEAVRGVVMGLVRGVPQPVTSGQVNIVVWHAGRPEEPTLIESAADVTGRFLALLPGHVLAGMGQGERFLGDALYLGTYHWAPSRSGPRRLS